MMHSLRPHPSIASQSDVTAERQGGTLVNFRLCNSIQHLTGLTDLTDLTGLIGLSRQPLALLPDQTIRTNSQTSLSATY